MFCFSLENHGEKKVWNTSKFINGRLLWLFLGNIVTWDWCLNVSTQTTIPRLNSKHFDEVFFPHFSIFLDFFPGTVIEAIITMYNIERKSENYGGRSIHETRLDTTWLVWGIRLEATTRNSLYDMIGSRNAICIQQCM